MKNENGISEYKSRGKNVLIQSETGLWREQGRLLMEKDK